jgi:hypothetical protein
MDRRSFATLAAIALAAPAAPAFAKPKPPTTWDNLVLVNSKKLQAVYLLPGADFRQYAKVMLDPTDVAFAKDWQRSLNDTTVGLSRRISDDDAQKIAEQVRTGFEDIFAKVYADAGYPVVTSPAHDVLRVRTGVANLTIDAPERDTIGRSRSYSVQAGAATLIVEVRDSLTGAVLGRAVDSRAAGDEIAQMRTSVSNRADFSRLFKTWAKASTNGLATLKELSPISADGQPAK